MADDLKFKSVAFSGHVDKDGEIEASMQALYEGDVYAWLRKDDAVRLIQHLAEVFDLPDNAALSGSRPDRVTEPRQPLPAVRLNA